ncbi:Rhodanese-like protein [Dentipellis sp. KUC8613]|nr:Rhodanese-like protein [Dentipellis sp. KUC8613]
MSTPWHQEFPEPASTPIRMTVEELHAQLSTAGKDGGILVVDVRRTDFENAFIRGAINLPAHSFYPTLPTLVNVLSRYHTVVFYCGSSNGRGPRVAGWYQDALGAQGITTSRAVVLEGGIKAWVQKFGESDLTCKLAANSE